MGHRGDDWMNTRLRGYIMARRDRILSDWKTFTIFYIVERRYKGDKKEEYS